MCFKHRLSQYNLDDNYIISLFKLKKLELDIKIIREISETSDKLVFNLKELMKEVQKAKRGVTKSIDYNKMSTFEFKTDIPQEYINNATEIIEKDILLAIYKLCLLNFENYIEGSLESTVKIYFFSSCIKTYNR